jgi:biopolymer transport protein ExbB
MMLEVQYSLNDFMEKGGSVLWWILVLTALLCWFIIERLWYFSFDLPKDRDKRLQIWITRSDHSSWYALYLRTQLISEIDCSMSKGLTMITTFIALLPMFGLLGTVTGMIQVFEVMASMGSGNPRAMADGVSAATIPTMAGMVVALAAIPFATHLDRRYKRELMNVKNLFSRD